MAAVRRTPTRGSRARRALALGIGLAAALAGAPARAGNVTCSNVAGTLEVSGAAASSSFIKVWQSGDKLTIWDQIQSKALSCGSANVANVDTVHVTGTAGTDLLMVDLSVGGYLGPGTTQEGDGVSEIEIVFDALGGPYDSLSLFGLAGGDIVAYDAAGLDYTGDGDADIASSAEYATIDTGAGNDAIAIGAAALSGLYVFGGAGDDSIAGAQTDVPVALISGGDGDDSITGGTSDEEIDGGAGNDRIDGGAGSDELTGGPGEDVLAVSVTATDVTLTPGRLEPDGDALAEFESAELTGGDASQRIDVSAYPSPVTVRAGDGDDTLIGGAGPSVLDGEAGDDTLIAGAGTDSLFGGEGDDVLTAALDASDELDGGDGSDLLDATVAGDVVLTDGGVHLLGAAAVVGIESARITQTVAQRTIDASAFGGALELIGSAGDDTLIGGPAGSSIHGEAGNDALAGGTAADELEGGAGDDTLDGSDGDDELDAGDGDDRLAGGDGHDVLRAWVSGGDSFDAGAGEDTLDVVAAGSVALTDAGFVVDAQTAPIAGSLGRVLISQTSEGHVIDASGYGGAVTIVGSAGSDTLIGGRSHDAIAGGDGDDVLVGGPGLDTLDGEDGVDTADADLDEHEYVRLDDLRLTAWRRDGSVVWIDEDTLSSIERATLRGGDLGQLFDATAFTGDVTIDAGGGVDVIRAGPGDDVLLLADGVPDVADAGPGDDRVTADPVDVVLNAEGPR